MNESNTRKASDNFRIRVGLVLSILGLLVFTLGIQPSLFALDRSPVVGFVQIAVFLVGLGMICLGGYTALIALWDGRDKTILADIGYRLIATGYVFAVVSGMADVFGFGSQPSPFVPFFGPYQASGVIFGQMMIIGGFLLMIPRSGQKKPSEDEPSDTPV